MGGLKDPHPKVPAGHAYLCRSEIWQVERALRRDRKEGRPCPSRTHPEWENSGWLVIERVVCREKP